MSGVRTTVLEALETRLKTLAWAKNVTWDRVRITASDFDDHEIPAIQFYCQNTEYTHQQSRVEAATFLSVEIILRSTVAGAVSQKTLLDYMEDTERKIGEDPSLGVPQMFHMRYVSDEIDLHTIEPFYVGRLNFEVLYHKLFSGVC